LQCYYIRNHLQGDLARFGYRPARKYKFSIKKFICWLVALTMCRKHGKFLDFFPNFGNFLKIIFNRFYLFLETKFTNKKVMVET
jgi:hypothetical protein